MFENPQTLTFAQMDMYKIQKMVIIAQRQPEHKYNLLKSRPHL